MNKIFKTKIITTITVLSLLLGIPAILAANNYYAKVVVYFTIPSDATFTIGFPSAYTPESISSTDENAPTQTTSWISFNFTSGTENWLQPRTSGLAANAQVGPGKPIFYIDNTGNVNEKFDLNGTVPTNFGVCANATCDTAGGASCGSVTSTCTNITSTYATMATAVTSTSFLNVTLYANATGASSGISSGSVWIKSSAV